VSATECYLRLHKVDEFEAYIPGVFCLEDKHTTDLPNGYF